MNAFHPAELWRLTRRAFDSWVEDGAPTMGASLAFYALFSMAPLLLVAIGLAGFVVGREDAQVALIGHVTLFVGEEAAMAVEDLLDAASSWEEGVIPAIVGVITLVFGATTVFAELRTDLDRIWRYKPARAQGGLVKLLAARFFSFLLVVGIGVLLLASLAASAAITVVGEELFGGAKAALRALEFATSFLVLTGLFAMIYKILPSARLQWRDVWVGAALTSALFWVGKFLIALYIAKTAPGSTFGAAGTLVLLIVWVYWSAQVFFLGAELTREFALRHGSHQGDRRLRKPLNDLPRAPDPTVEPERRARIAPRLDPHGAD